MYKKYKTPAQLFLFFEKIKPALFLSKSSREHSVFLLLPSKLLAALAFFLKNEVFLGPSYLVDASCVDSQELSAWSKISGEPVVFYIYYFFFLKKRIIFLFFKNSDYCSVDSIYPSANWLEREFSEMFGVSIFEKVDARNLLLDYSLNENPLLKSFPTVGLRELHYSVLAEGVVYSNASAVEL